MPNITTVFENNLALEVFEFELLYSMRINEIPCEKGRVWVYADGTLFKATLARPFYLGSWLIPTKSEIILNKKGQIKEVICTKNLCKGIFNNLKFDSKSYIYSVTPENSEDLNGFPCLGSHEILLYPDGSIKQCALSKDLDFNGCYLQAGKFVTFDSKGNILI